MSDLYDARLKELAQRRAARLQPPALSATLDNPLCGDRVSVDLRLEQGRVAAIGYEVKGCLLCQAAMALLAERAIGQSPAALARESEDFRRFLKEGAALPAYALFAPVGAHKSRHDCVLLPHRALGIAAKQT